MQKKNIYILIIVMLIGVFLWFQISKNSDAARSDKNRNEVWDDVEAKIMELNISEDMKKALFQLAIGLQKSCSEPKMNKERALELVKEHDLALGCIYAIDTEMALDLDLTGKVEGWVASSIATIRNYARFNGLLSGGMYPSPPETLKSCNFKVSD
jgi:hypothetical protein